MLITQLSYFILNIILTLIKTKISIIKFNQKQVNRKIVYLNILNGAIMELEYYKVDYILQLL